MSNSNPEQRRVYIANYRAKKIGAEASLTLEEWAQTLERVGRQCVYCGGPFEVMDHAEGLAAGTNAENCVPACYVCNALKGDDPSFRRRRSTTSVPKARAARRDACVWAEWVQWAGSRKWAASALTAYGKHLLTNKSPRTVYQTISQVNRLAVERGLPSLTASPTVVRFRATLLSP